MKRFVIEGNISRYLHRLATETDSAMRKSLEGLLSEARRDLALFDSEQLGSRPQFSERESKSAPGQSCATFLQEFSHSPRPYLLIDPGPGLKIVDVNDAYCAATMIDRSAVRGRPLFEVFPDNPDQQLADGVSNLFRSIQTVVQTCKPNEMAVQRYDVRNPDGDFVRRYWKPVNSPLFDDRGNIALILHHVEDVTGQAGATE
jgi:PAS domain-containing protein